MNSIKSVITDLLEQFKGKPNIDGVSAAVDRQIQELVDAYNQIQYETALYTAYGVQLDKIGDIVGLTRAEAGLLCGDTIYLDVLDDETYRKYLKYQAFKNSNDCTYYDLVKAMKMVWDVDEIDYIEDPDYPATIILSTPTMSGGEPVDLSEIPPIHPAGVGLTFLFLVKTVIEVHCTISYISYGTPLCGTIDCGTYPETATLGKTEITEINSDALIDVFENEYTLSGTTAIGGDLVTATLGSAKKSGISSGAEVIVHKGNYVSCGQAKCGIYF